MADHIDPVLPSFSRNSTCKAMRGIAAMGLALCSVVSNAAQYLCVADKAAGFKWVAATQSWEPTPFRTEDKFIIKTNDTPGVNGAYSVSNFGASPGAYGGTCTNDFNEYGYLFCDTVSGQIRFNRKNGRYLSSYLTAYDTVGVGVKTDAESDTPAVTIGRCSPF